ncbi:MAG: pentapeptide repeat-containing protein [Desulfobacteraceae bacterium]|nr:pentapeptide repeat-containing protein [Desulfobacteraceae bacterium]
MANQKHVEILQKGVTYWNRWRSDEPYVKPNLSESNLIDLDLTSANLNQTNLRKADLRRSVLTKAILTKADLRNSHMREAHLGEAVMTDAKISGANLMGAHMKKAILDGADLRRTNLTRADLHEAHLIDADISDANLSNAQLFYSKLKNARLRGANMMDSVLGISDLSFADFTLANITGAKLYGSIRDDWKIDGVKCDYIYWDIKGLRRTPRDRNFKPGEFEHRYKTLPVIEYVFENGFTMLSAVVMERVVKHIKEQEPEFELNLERIEFRGKPRAVFSLLQNNHREKALKWIDELFKKQAEQIREGNDKIAGYFSGFHLEDN